METSATALRIVLPDVPGDQAGRAVAAWSEPVEIDTYLPEDPQRLPAFLHSRVYQGSSGRVHPLPFHERISASPSPRRWEAIHLENEWVRVTVLPELGGRVHIAFDKSSGHDMFYRNNVIKPALVGLAGPWIAGGIEFNWPQHHRPATFLPTDVHLEFDGEGAAIAWCSDHDPFHRMKGMHGIRLSPSSSRIELLGRVYNRTDLAHPFLWWANAAAPGGPTYQSFFPQDVGYVADHARRAITAFPAADRAYYGIDYPARAREEPGADRLDWPRNIPVPTSYMVIDTADEFFGGYDHGTNNGFVHWAPREVSPGKKQWTWGNAPFGRAWERLLTDADGPYIELMAGVFTDNQPDFAWLAPGETKTFRQCWYPIRSIGPATHASREIAASLVSDSGSGGVRLGLVASEELTGVTVRIQTDGESFAERIDLAPNAPWTIRVAGRLDSATFTVDRGDTSLIAGSGQTSAPAAEPEPAREPPAPADVETNDELCLIGSYLQQYRHATRAPEDYWREALQRDAGDTRANTAMAQAELRRARFDSAERFARQAVSRSTEWVRTPPSGQAHYLLGLALLRQGEILPARAALARAAWDDAFHLPAGFALARSLAHTDRARAAEWLDSLVSRHPQHSQSRVLLGLLRREAGDEAAGKAAFEAVLAADPLDQWARDALGLPVSSDASTRLDVALEYAWAGLSTDALRVLEAAEGAASRLVPGQIQVLPLVHYHRARILDAIGDATGAAAAADSAREADATWCAASRLDDVVALEHAVVQMPDDRRAWLLLGDWYFAHERSSDAVEAWERAARSGDPAIAAVALRNLGIAAFTVHHDAERARACFDRAFTLLPGEARLLFERDQLRERLQDAPLDRLGDLERHPDLVRSRDDLTVALARLLVAAGREGEAVELLATRPFQPWEGGEGAILAAWEQALVAVARRALDAGDPVAATAALRRAIDPPDTLGEVHHPLANRSELHLRLGDALAAEGDRVGAADAWRAAASSRGDFADMRPAPFSARTAFAIIALERLGERAAAEELTNEFAAWIESQGAAASTDYFATSLPTTPLFPVDEAHAKQAQLAALRDALSLARAREAGAVSWS